MIKRISNSHYSEDADKMAGFTKNIYRIVTKNTGHYIILFALDNINFEIFDKVKSFYEASYNDIERICS